MARCDVCGCEVQGPPVTRTLYSAQRVEKVKDAVWATSRVTLHFVEFQEHDVLVCARCRREALRFYLEPFIPFVVTVVLYAAWLLLQPAAAPDAAPIYVVAPGALPLLLLLLAPAVVRRRYGVGEVQFGETPLRMFSLDHYLVYRLSRENPDRVYWTPRWYRYYQSRFR